jgi:hypothetical protein
VLPLSVNVKLKSDLDNQIKFQLENENLRGIKDALSSIQEDDFNQLFNDVNLIEDVTIGPLATVVIVMSYRPLAQEVHAVLSFFLC